MNPDDVSTIPDQEIPGMKQNLDSARTQIADSDNSGTHPFSGALYAETGKLWSMVVQNFVNVLSETMLRLDTSSAAVSATITVFQAQDGGNAEDLRESGSTDGQG